mgnify:CR=1 FL=1
MLRGVFLTGLEVAWSGARREQVKLHRVPQKLSVGHISLPNL